MNEATPAKPLFSAHSIRLADGTFTISGATRGMDSDPRFLAAKRALDVVFPGEKKGLRIADLGCLEGGYTVELARLGFEAVGIEVRKTNFDACEYVRARVGLPSLSFVNDDVWNIERYGSFDAVFCCGVFYHLDRPREFLRLLSRVTRRLLILQTHFAERRDRLAWLGRAARLLGMKSSAAHYRLSGLAEHEGLRGRWYPEFSSEGDFRRRESMRWASWDNRRSFWVMREDLLEAIHTSGFDLVLEQFDELAPGISRELIEGSYRRHARGTFLGIKTAATG